jgi:GNAT superfamily N-acetyltransferase
VPEDYTLLPLSQDIIPLTFCCGSAQEHRDLDEFLLQDAITYQNQHIGTTKIISIDNRIVGYFTLCSSEVNLKTKENWLYPKVKMEYFPAIKLARFAIQQDYQRKGIGEKIIKYVIGLAITLNSSIGCRFVLVDAIPDSVPFYEKMGFIKNLSYSSKKRRHPSLRLDIYSDLK